MAKQEKIDITAEFGDAETKLSEGFKGKITNIEETTNEEYYKTKGLYDLRNGYKITVRVEVGDEFSQFIGKPSHRGLFQSNLYQFKEKYGSYPEIGQIVDVKIDDDGFYRIDI